LEYEEVKVHEVVKTLCAVVPAVFTKDELEMLLFLECEGRVLEHYATDAPLPVTVFKVVMAAQKEGWLALFIKGAMTIRPDIPELIALQERYRPQGLDQARRPAPAAGPPSSLHLMDSAHFDLTEIREAIRAALLVPSSQVIGFGISYFEAQFVQKLLDWLKFYLPGQTQPRPPLTLMPEAATVEECLAQVRSHRNDLDAVNVLCEVPVRGVSVDIIGGFWTGARAEFGALTGRLVLLFTGDSKTKYPDGLAALPQPRFSRQDVAHWAENVIWQQGWPPALAHNWTDWLCAAASIQGDQLNVRQLYQAMDKSIIDFCHEPDGFRAMLENRM
jgi:hypothetical protein